MPQSKKPEVRTRTVKRTLADGTVKEYQYDLDAPRRTRRAGADVDQNSVRALVEAWQRSAKWRDYAASTRAQYGHYLKELDHFATIPMGSVTTRHLMMHRETIAMTRGNGAATAFMHMAGAAFRWAVRNHLIERTPCYDIEPLEGGELKAWTAAQADEAEKLLRAEGSASAEAIRRVIVLGRYTGQRRGDLIGAWWKDIDGSVIHFRQQKTGENVEAPIAPELAAELAAWKGVARSVFILTNSRGQPWTGPHLTHAMPLMLAKIGMPRDLNLNVHGLRKLAATELAQWGCTPHEIAAITGHRSLAMVQHYTKTADRSRLAKAAAQKRENARLKTTENVVQLIETKVVNS